MNGWIERFIEDMGYLGLTLFSFLENIFPPIPSEVVLPLGGFLVAQGTLSFAGVILAGTSGSILGALVLYWVGSFISRQRLEAWASKHGKWLLLTRSDINDAFDWFDRHDKAAVFLCRLVPGVRSLISIPAGASRMPLATFLLYSSLGTLLWSILLVSAGIWLGQQNTSLNTVLDWLARLVFAMTLFSIVSWLIKRHREKDVQKPSQRSSEE